VNIRACIFIVIKPLVVALKLKWKPSNCNDIIVINEKSQSAIGIIKDISVIIANTQTFIPLQVINLTSKTLLLRSD